MFNLKKLFRRRPAGVFVGRRRTRDISFLAQSPAGIIGRVTRFVPTPIISADVNDTTNPVASFGLAVLNTSTNTVRGMLATDAGISAIAGIAAQPYPFQPSSGTNYGAQPLTSLTAVPPGVLDVLRQGFETVYCNNGASATKTSPVCVWVAASTGNHIQGGFEIAPSATVASAATEGNTGNGTLGALTVTAGEAEDGVYTVQFTGATTFNVYDVNGRGLLAGKTGVAYSAAGVNFTITAGGTAFVAGDSFTVTVTYQTITLGSNSYFNGPGDSTGATELAFNL
jgi:hypothetical protein